jgi:hypothetical protein
MKVLVLRMLLGLTVAGLPLAVAVAQPAPETAASMGRPANPGGEVAAEQKTPSETKPASKPAEDKRTKTSLPVMGKWGKSGVDIADCVQQLHNYYYRLVAYELGKKVDSGDNREALLEDLAAVRLGMDSGKIRDRDPKTPQRWKTWLTPADQAEVDEMQKKFQEEVRDDCYKRFGQ